MASTEPVTLSDDDGTVQDVQLIDAQAAPNASDRHDDLPGRDPEDALREVSATIPFQVEDPASPETMPDRQALALSWGYPRRNEDVQFPDQTEESNWYYFSKDGRFLGNEDWFTLQKDAVRAVLRGQSEGHSPSAPGLWPVVIGRPSRMYSSWRELPISTGKGRTCPDCSGRTGIQGATNLPPLFSGFSIAGSGI